MGDDEIVAVAIHPAIGIARVGNSPDGWFVGPEVPGAWPPAGHTFRDAHGRIERQAARFRVYGLDRDGVPVREITAAEARITWTVHLANQKAAWFAFDVALDAPAAATRACVRRNRRVRGDERRQLVIDPGPRSIEGRHANRDGAESACAFDSGRFGGETVYLGELRTDEEGRLLVLGGRGRSAAPGGEPIVGSANNDGWHDDVSDGPVDAIVRIGDRQWRATGAWVVVAPPDYAPGVHAVVTGHDAALVAAVRLDPALEARRPSFAAHILPVLARMSRLQWVNAGFLQQFGFGSPCDFTSEALQARLADPSPRERALRHSVAARFRSPDDRKHRADAWPPLYGDEFHLTFEPTSRLEWLAVTPLQHGWLQRWAEGDFDGGLPRPPAAWQDMPAREQAQALDRAALENTSGGAFRPGLELPWVIRSPWLYEQPWRIRRAEGAEPDWGLQLTRSMAHAHGGPIARNGPGTLTRWLGCPWQADTAACLSAYRVIAGEYLPAFWPAHVPNDVLSAADHAVLADESLPAAQRQAALAAARRRKWGRGLLTLPSWWLPPQADPAFGAPAALVDAWHGLGIVLPRPGPGGEFPDEVLVETGRALGEPPQS